MQEFEKWINKAEDDLYNVQLLLIDDNCQPDICCFHSHQSADKCLKSFFVSSQLNFPKTYDLELLVKLIFLQKQDKNVIDTALKNYRILCLSSNQTHNDVNFSYNYLSRFLKAVA